MNQMLDSGVSSAPSSTGDFFKEVETIYMLDQPAAAEPERRQSPRLSVMMPVEITALNDNLDPIEGIYEGITRDISTLGVGFVSLDPIARKFLRVKLIPIKGEPLVAIARVIYQKEIGFYYQYGCQFITPDNEHFPV